MLKSLISFFLLAIGTVLTGTVWWLFGEGVGSDLDALPGDLKPAWLAETGLASKSRKSALKASRTNTRSALSSASLTLALETDSKGQVRLPENSWIKRVFL